MKFIFQYPETNGTDGDLLDAGPIGELAAAAEAAGWDAMAFTEHPAPSARWLEAGGHQSLDPFIALSFVAAATERLRLLTNLSVVPYRNPSLLAKTAASLDRLSNGRLILGVGTGYMKSEFNALGVSFDERNTLFDEALDVLALHWSGEPFDYQGSHFNAVGIQARPRPTQRDIPIWIGGNSALSRRRVAARAQGWLPMVSQVDISQTTRTPHIGSIDQLSENINEIRRAAPDRTLEVAMAYGTPGLSRSYEDAQHHRELFARYQAIGVDWIIISVDRAAGPKGTTEFLQRFAGAFINP